jgi:hypothetical protein
MSCGGAAAEQLNLESHNYFPRLLLHPPPKVYIDPTTTGASNDFRSVLSVLSTIVPTVVVISSEPRTGSESIPRNPETGFAPDRDSKESGNRIRPRLGLTRHK